MRRLVVLVTVVLLMTAMLVGSAAPALAVLLSREPKCCRVSQTTACNTVAGVAGFEWRAGGSECWLDLPAWELVQDTQNLEAS